MAKNTNIKPFEFESISECLTDRQKLFCMYYVGETKFNGSKAARMAGYEPKGANSYSSYLLSNINISKHIDLLKKDLGLRIGVTAEMIANEYKKIGFSNVKDILNEDNGLSSISSLNRDISSTIKKVKVRQMSNSEGENIGEMVEVELHDKISGLQNLSKMIGVQGVDKIAQTDSKGNDVKRLTFEVVEPIEEAPEPITKSL